MKQSKISNLSKVLILASGVFLLISIFVPIWRIELDAPQYPEGMVLLIYANHLGGQVDIINGLNHYIGMKTLHANEFVEFTVLPYIIGFFSILSIIVAVLGRKKLLLVLLGLFIFFGVIAMVDFWRWEYDYGHNLDPKAAIIVPGMAYQPPLLGYKQLLNFGVYSIPALGGWLFILSGLMMLCSTFMEYNWIRYFRKSALLLTMFSLFAIFVSCQSNLSEPIILNRDNCDFCKMTISDGHFATEFRTKKGRYYKFDDLACLVNFKKKNSEMQIVDYFINDFSAENKLISAEHAYIVQGESISSPMGGNFAAFQNKEFFLKSFSNTNTLEKKWADIIK